MNWALFQNSLVVGSLTTIVAVAFGLVTALFVFGLPKAGRSAALALAIIALALPPFLVTNSWLHFLGQTGVWRGAISWNVSSFGGTIWILSLLLWPIAMFAILGAWQRLEPPQLESDLAVRGWPLFRRVLLPLGRGALAQAAILIFVLAFNNFSVPTLLQVKTFPSEAWIRFNTSFDSIGAAKLSLPMVAASVLVILGLAGRGAAWPHAQPSVPAALVRRQFGRLAFALCGCAAAVLFALSALLPVAQILSVKRTWTELPGAIEAGQVAIWNSFWIPAVCASVILAASALTGMGFHRRGNVSESAATGPGTFLGWLLWLPFLIPGVLLGITFIALFNHPWSALFYQSAGIIILALFIRYLAFGWNTVGHACRGADPDLVDAARIEGAGRWQLFRHAYWPQISAQLGAGWYIIFLLCLWDVESIILIIPPRIGETLALRIFNLLHYGHNAQVNALCFTLLGVALAPLVFWALAKGVRAALVRSRYGTRVVVVLGAVFVPLLLQGCGRNPAVELHSRFFSDVKIIGSRGVGVGQFNKPRSVAVDRKDNLYVVDTTGRVQKFSSNGVYLLSWQMPEIDRGKPKGMCCDRDGNIVVVEPHYSRLNHFTPQGRLVLQWGVRGTNDGQFFMPRDAAVNSKNEIFVPEYLQRERVQKFSMNQIVPDLGPKWISSFGRPGNGPGEFNRAEGVWVDTHDQVYVADSCNHRIQVFSSDGKLLRMFGKPGRGEGELSYPYGICVDAAGYVYVSEFGNSRLQVFDPQGQSVEIIGERGADPGEFSNPWGMALDSAGNLYVADSQNHRVQKLIRKRGGSSLAGNRLRSSGVGASARPSGS